MQTLIETFPAHGRDGRTYTVQIWRHHIDTSTLAGRSTTPGLKSARLADGRALNYIDPDTFEIVATGERIIRAR